MGFYDSPKNIEQYIEMAAGYDGRALIDEVRRFLPVGSSVLEIGMGPGVDLDILLETYDAIGSDSSKAFLQRYITAHPGASLLELDAATLETDQRFDAIYSNKVLHHLSPADLRRSIRRQAAILKPRGFAFHSFWYGEEVEEMEGMFFYQHTEESLQPLVAEHFHVVELWRYTEMETDDSLFAILRRR